MVKARKASVDAGRLLLAIGVIGCVCDLIRAGRISAGPRDGGHESKRPPGTPPAAASTELLPTQAD